MKVGITGASGFVGGAIARAFAAEGWIVAPIGRRESRRYDLGDPVDPRTVADLDAVVHAAYAPGADNVAAAARLSHAARAAGVPRLAFVSSFAAGPDAASAYGREKYQAERHFDGSADVVVRPGLVAGNGGLYAAMRRAIVRFGLAPVFDGGDQPVYLVEAEELARAVVALVVRDSRGTYACASSEPIAFSRLCAAIGAAAGKRVRLVRVPVALALWVARAFERIGLRPPVSSESVRGIANLRAADVPTYPEIGFAFSPPGEAVRRAEGAFA